MLEPPKVHPPVPLPSLMALTGLCLAWNWWREALLLLLGFFGLLRPIEYTSLTARHILLDMDGQGNQRLLLAVEHPKTRVRGARQQYARVDEPAVCDFWLAMRGQLLPSERIWPWSMTTWRWRLTVLCRHLDIPSVLPSSLRTGGATHLFQEWGEDLPRLLWRGRWTNPKVLGHYIQELATVRILKDRPLPRLAQELASLVPALLREVAAGVCAER